jgi:mono/diheme cytochrome c family protein
MRKAIKITLIVVGSLLGLLVVAVLGIMGISIVRQHKTYAVAPELLTLTASPDTAHGRHLVAMLGCQGCHTSDLGGQVMEQQPGFGRFVARNLTRGRGGVGMTFTTADYVRAIRYGVGPDSRSLVFMPSMAYEHLSDADLASVIAILQAATPVDRELPPTHIGPLARVISVLTPFPLLVARYTEKNAARTKPPETDTLAYGTYLARTMGCNECHGRALEGNPGAGAPNLTKGGPTAAWSEADFTHAIREGKRPDGTTLSDQMPWKEFGNMTGSELHAVWVFVRSVPAVAPAK